MTVSKEICAIPLLVNRTQIASFLWSQIFFSFLSILHVCKMHLGFSCTSPEECIIWIVFFLKWNIASIECYLCFRLGKNEIQCEKWLFSLFVVDQTVKKQIDYPQKFFEIKINIIWFTSNHLLHSRIFFHIKLLITTFNTVN